ncbi:hypothetical protein VKT23_014379 [Stygiomarasmius scandens]|uniref:Uncharacterized protein n=1 Tax=Marasmiellus scandens TaxID=2682957 RepID=A0ABR1J0T4_9AGAR
MSSILIQGDQVLQPSSITSIPSSIAVLDNIINMTCKDILSRAGLHPSNTADLHPPPLPSSRFFQWNNPRAVASLYVFEMVAPKLAESVFTFIDEVAPKHTCHDMTFNICNEDHGGVTVECGCGFFARLGSMDYFEERDFELCLGQWDTEEKALEQHCQRLEEIARRTRDFQQIIDELAALATKENDSL